MASRSFNGADKAKLIQIVNEGIQVMTEVEDLTAGLNDTIKAIAEELEIKPSLLKKAILSVLLTEKETSLNKLLPSTE